MKIITKKQWHEKASRYPDDPLYLVTSYYLFGKFLIWQKKEIV